MHADQVDVTAETVRVLVDSQFPAWVHLPVRHLTSHGTVNALFRLGDDIVLRFPLQPGPDVRAGLAREQDNARRIAAVAPLDVPEPLALGEPGDGYNGSWAAYRWIPGHSAGLHVDEPSIARTLADFVTSVHTMDTEGNTWNGEGRGGPLADHDSFVRESLAASTHLTDTRQLSVIWSQVSRVPQHDADTWIHADLMPGNLLIRDDSLVAVIDLEAVRIGDPAVDLMPAWNMFDAGAHTAYRTALGADDDMWSRGRGWALLQAIGALPYYQDTNPVMAATATRTLDAILRRG